MAKHFGMKIGNFMGDNVFGSVEVKAVIDIYADWKFHIHPDSLPLLEPQVGDIIFIAGAGGDSDIAVEFSDPHLDPANDKQIIQRDGKPFMWPESEVA